MDDGPSVRLRAAIDERGGNIRAIARGLAGKDASDGDVETWRRAIYRGLEGQGISRPNALRFAKFFGTTPDYFIRPDRQAGAGRRAAAVDAKELEDLRASLRSLEAGLKALGRTVRAQERRLRALEPQATRKAAGTGRATPK